MFNPRAFENTRPDGVAVLEIPPAPGSPEDTPPRLVPLKQTELTGEVVGPLGALRLKHVFGYTRAQCDQVLEAVYRFPLPGDAAVTGVRVHFGAVEIRADLKERTRAEADYEKAKQEGRQAALLTRESPSVFTLQVAGIAPDQDVTVETEYVQLARAEGTGWSLRVPLTTAPRYVRSDEINSRHAQGQPLYLLRDPGHRFALDVAFTGGGEVESPTHPLTMTAADGKVRVRLSDGEVVPDRDCVLRWRPPQEAERASLQVALHEDESGHVYFLARVAPPRVRPKGAGVARETVLLVDHSGSMQGPKWAAADWAVKKFLSELGERDAFGLGLFHNTTRWLGESLSPGTPAAVKKAVEFLEAHKDSGGTELGVALEQALGKARVKGEAARHVLVITDAEVSDEGRILRLADEESRQPDRRRIDVLCIDAAPNSFLAGELAERGGGVSKFLTSAPEELDVTTALEEVLADWAQPVHAGLRLEVNRGEVQAAGRAVLSGDAGKRCIDLGDLPAGRSVWVAGRVPRGSGDDLTFRVLTADNREASVCRPTLADARRPALKALFGARRVLGLEHLINAGYSGQALREHLVHLGYDDADLEAGGAAKVYAENARAEAGDAVKKLLVREALRYGLASAETAFVAVRQENGSPVAGTVYVANVLPAGWSGQFVGARGAFLGAAMYSDCLASAAPAPRASMGWAPDPADTTTDYDSAAENLARGSGPKKSLRGIGGAPRGSYKRQSGGRGAPPPAAAAPPTTPRGGQGVLFADTPRFQANAAVLFDSTRPADATRVPDAVTLTRVQVEFPDGAPAADAVDSGLTLEVFVDDLAAPRARVRLADLVRQGGERPLNLVRAVGQQVRLVLSDPSGAWASAAPKLRVILHWA
jgi:Ca-activated chloride channel homolog